MVRGSRPGVNWTTVETCIAGSGSPWLTEACAATPDGRCGVCPFSSVSAPGSAGPTASSPLPWREAAGAVPLSA